MTLRVDSPNELPEQHRKQVLEQLRQRQTEARDGIKAVTGGKSHPERDLSQQIEVALNLKQWEYYHVYEQANYARRSTKGFPDYLCFRVPKVLAIEVKSETGKLSKAQLNWKTIFELCGIPYYILRPSTWDSICEVLK